jgi:uncharacterized protein DUF6438
MMKPFALMAAALCLTSISAGAGCQKPQGDRPSASNAQPAARPEVEVVAERLPTRHMPMPRGASESVRLRLERGACFGPCPVYAIELNGDGRAVFEGTEHTFVRGRREFRVSPQVVGELLERFRAADFWSLNSQYRSTITDQPTFHLSAAIGGKTKSVEDYAGERVGMPAVVTELENEIDRVGGAKWWVEGEKAARAGIEDWDAKVLTRGAREVSRR